MLKDPNHEAETPYELLGLALDAPPAEVHQALARFMRDRRNIARLGRAQEAMKALKSPRERAGIDVWFYELETAGPAAAVPAAGGLDLSEFRRVPVWDLQSVALEVEPLPPEAETVATMVKPKLSDIRRYEAWDARALRPALDR